ncbi:MAG: hypothetical protein BRD43_01055 [Bacteroidetes bacterium QS_4_64_154]|nr:MAG: hypothetical protein BRD43_01055 [Bacteroidetes bacterium QS_4_64_154]
MRGDALEKPSARDDAVPARPGEAFSDEADGPVRLGVALLRHDFENGAPPPDAPSEVLVPDGAEFDRLLRSGLAASPRAVPPPEEREGRADRCPCIGEADPLPREKLLDEPFTAPPAW